MLHVLTTFTRMQRLVRGPVLDAELRYTARPGGRLAWLDHGRGPEILLVHAPGGLRSEWRHLLPELALHRLVVPDLRGHGDSDVLAGADVTGDLLRILDDAGIERAMILASGASVPAVRRLAAERPERVRRIVQFGPSTGIRTGVLTLRPWGPLVIAARILAGQRRPPGDARAYAGEVRRSLARPGRLESALAIGGRLVDVDVPVLDLTGVEGSGDSPHAEVPDVCAAAIARFVREDPRRALTSPRPRALTDRTRDP